MRIRVLAVTALLICASLAARAEDCPAAGPQSTTPKQSLERAPADSSMEKMTEPVSGRFSFYRVDGGFLRFDSQMGQIAFCNSHNSVWTCEAVPENRAALEKQVDQLRAEIAELKQQLKTQEEPPRPPQSIPSPPQNPPAASPPGNGDSTALPGREEFARAAAALQGAWNRFVELVMGLKNEMQRKI
jgi:hypothetical protein